MDRRYHSAIDTRKTTAALSVKKGVVIDREYQRLGFLCFIQSKVVRPAGRGVDAIGKENDSFASVDLCQLFTKATSTASYSDVPLPKSALSIAL